MMFCWKTLLIAEKCLWWHIKTHNQEQRTHRYSRYASWLLPIGYGYPAESITSCGILCGLSLHLLSHTFCDICTLAQAISQKSGAVWGSAQCFPMSWMHDICSCPHSCWPRKTWLYLDLILSVVSSQDCKLVNGGASLNLQLLESKQFANISILIQKSKIHFVGSKI